MGRLVSTIALVAVLAGLGGYIYFVDSKRPVTGVEEKEKVFTVEADKIEEITLTSDSQTSTLRKTDGTWRMTAPVQADADQTEVSTLTSNLSTLEVNRVVEENASDLGNYGLASPRIAVAFKAQGGAAGQLHLGEKTATQSDVYAVKPSEKRVFLIPSFQETSFAKKPFDLRDKRILKFERDKIDSVEFAQDAKAIQLARTDSVWALKQPIPARGDYSAIEGLVTRLSSANMTRLVDDAQDLVKYGLDKPSVRLTLGAGSARATLAIGKEEEGAVYAQDPARNLVFTIDTSLAADLKKGADDFREKNLFEFRNFNLARLRITRGSQTYEFQKAPATGDATGDKWQRVDGGKTSDVDATTMDDFLAKVTALRAQSFVATALDKPELVFSASYDNGKFERVRMAKTSEALASRDGEPGTAKLDPPAYDSMIQALDAVIAPPAPPAK